MARDIGDAAKWARARAMAAEEEGWQAGYEEYKRGCLLDARFQDAGAADVLRMFETGTNEKGEPLSQFEFEALCERWCAVFGELPPFGPPDDTPPTKPDPSAHAALGLNEPTDLLSLCSYIRSVRTV